jgi:hypothetical protein
MRTTLLAAMLALAACDSPQGHRPGDAGRAELAVRTLMAAHESADTTLLMDLFWPQATYDDFAAQHTYQGLEEIVGYVTSVHDWGDHVYKNVSRVHVTERGAVAEWIFSATQNRPLGSIAPRATGNEVVLSGVTIIELEGDRIMRAADYTDTQPLLLQLGARIELPGGGVIGPPS